MLYVASCEGTYEEFKGLRAIYDQATATADQGGIFAVMAGGVADAALDAMTKSIQRQCDLVEENGFAEGTIEAHYIAAETWQAHRGLNEEIDECIDFLQDKLVALIIDAEIAEELEALTEEALAEEEEDAHGTVPCAYDLTPVNAAIESTRLEMALTILEDVEFACEGRQADVEVAKEIIEALIESLQG